MTKANQSGRRGVCCVVWLVALLLGLLLATGNVGAFVYPACFMILICLLAQASCARKASPVLSWKAGSLLCLGLIYVYIRSRPEFTALGGRSDFLLAVLGAAVFVVTRWLVVRGQWTVTLVVLLLGFVCLANLAFGLVQVFGDDSHYFPVPGYQRTGYHRGPMRMGGFFNQPNHLAAYLGVVTVCIVARFLTVPMSWLRRVVWCGVAGVAVTGMVLTWSRAVPVAAAVAIGVVVVLSAYTVRGFHGFWPAYFGITVVAIGCVVIAGFSLGLEAMQVQRAEGILGGTVERKLMREVSYVQLAEHPLFGAGPGTYVDYSRRYRDPEWPRYLQDADPKSAHSDIVQVPAEYGLVGLALAGAVFLLIFARAGQCLCRLRAGGGPGYDLQEGAWWIAGVGALVFFLVHSMVEFPLRSPALVMLLALILAVASGISCRRREWQWLGGSLVAVGVVITGVGWAVFSWGPASYYAEAAKHRGRGERVRALGDLGRAIELDDENADYRFQAGAVWREFSAEISNPTVRRSFLNKAVSYFKEANSLHQRNFVYLEALALALDEVGDFAGAERYHRECQELAPRHRRSRVNFCLHRHVWALESRSRRDLEAAVNRYEKVLTDFGDGDPRLETGLRSIREQIKELEAWEGGRLLRD